MTTRRDFLRQSATTLAAGIIIPRTLYAGAPKNVAASDRLNVALVGCRSMGWYDLSDIMRIIIQNGVILYALTKVKSGGDR